MNARPLRKVLQRARAPGRAVGRAASASVPYLSDSRPASEARRVSGTLSEVVDTAPALPDPLERLRWLVRLRWVAVPIFIVLGLSGDLLLSRPAPWMSLALGCVLFALNGVAALVVSVDRPDSALLRFARLDAALFACLPVGAAILHNDPVSALRYGVLLAVVGAAIALPRTRDVAIFGVGACLLLVVADAIALRFDPGRVTSGLVTRWITEWGILATVAMLAAHLVRLREQAESSRRRVIARFEEGRREWEASFQGLSELVFVTDRHSRVIRFNGAFAKALGARSLELADRPLDEVLAGHPERWWAEAEGVFEIEDPAFDTLFEVAVTRVGEKLVRVARDVGEERRLYARLVEADKLAAVGALVAGVAHEVSNPTAFVTANLNELKSYFGAYESTLAELGRLAEEAGRAEQARAVLGRHDVVFARREAPGALEESLAGMERICRIAANLRSLTRRAPAREPLQPVALAEVVEAVTRAAARELRAAEARVEVRDPTYVLGRRGELLDVVLNLVVNAVQAREEGRPNRIMLELFREESSAVIRVSDTGRGIDPSQLKRIFEPHFGMKYPERGAGAGLALTRHIVLSLGGSIDVETHPGQGSTFTVRLPSIDVEPGEEIAHRRTAGA